MKRPIPFIAGKLFAILLLLIMVFDLLIKTRFVSFLSGIQDSIKFRNSVPPQGFIPIFMWLLPHFLLLIIVVCFWLWDITDITKYITIIVLIVYTILNAYFYALLFTIPIWFLEIYLIIRKPPKVIFLLLSRMKLIKEEIFNNIKFKSLKHWYNYLGFGFILVLIIPTVFFVSFPTINYDSKSWDTINNIDDFSSRISYARNNTIENYPTGYYTQLVLTYMGLPVLEHKATTRVNYLQGRDGADFAMNYLLRLLYLNNKTNVLTNDTKSTIENALLDAKYWITEEGDTSALFWTENHQISYHTAELLSGQLFKTTFYNNSQMTGEEHIQYAEAKILQWIDWRAKFGFSEYHSASYFEFDFGILLNLVEFAQNTTISQKAAMLLDLMLFDLANSQFRNTYATSHGRCYDDDKISYIPGDSHQWNNLYHITWFYFGIGVYNKNKGPNTSDSFILTSEKYKPSPILEAIAKDAIQSNEFRDRNGLSYNEGNLYNISYTGEDLMYWWGMTGYLLPQTFNNTLNLIEEYSIDSTTVFGGDFITDFMLKTAKRRGISIEEYLELIKEFTIGMSMGSANTYTYRTNEYQLSGLQDYQKGLNSVQEHVWQATLSDDAFVFTNSPGGISYKGGEFMGGWLPKATFHKNIGIIQYDHQLGTIGANLITYLLDSGMSLIGDNRPKNHAYFPRWAFDEVKSVGKWTFGAKDDGFIALYSKRPTFWASNYELVSIGKTNTWIVELGNVQDYTSFDNFIQEILTAEVTVKKLANGFSIKYQSPSQGLVSVDWNSPLVVDGSIISFDYQRFMNKYTISAEFGSSLTIFQLNNEKLTLDFENNIRLYEIV